jgi:hypothetical protein
MPIRYVVAPLRAQPSFNLGKLGGSTSLWPSLVDFNKTHDAYGDTDVNRGRFWLACGITIMLARSFCCSAQESSGGIRPANSQKNSTDGWRPKGSRANVRSERVDEALVPREIQPAQGKGMSKAAENPAHAPLDHAVRTVSQKSNQPSDAITAQPPTNVPTTSVTANPESSGPTTPATRIAAHRHRTTTCAITNARQIPNRMRCSARSATAAHGIRESSTD